MALASEIINLAYREANFRTVDSEPTPTEFSEGLTLLKPLVSNLPGMVTGIRLRPWFVPTPQKTGAVAAQYPALSSETSPPLNIKYPPSNSRLMLRDPDDIAIFFQYQPQAGAVMEYVDTGHAGIVTLDGNGSFFGLTGSTEAVVIDPAAGGGRNPPRRWHYRADYGAWQELRPLTLTSLLPYPEEFDDYFISALAIRLSPRFGSEPRQITLMRFQQMESHIGRQWIQSEDVLAGVHSEPTLQAYSDTWRDMGPGR